MIPILYDTNEAAFVSNGLGRLRDCISAVVTEERNGVYELDFEYPIDGANYDLIQVGRIVGVTHDESGDVQPFDIVSYTKPIDGIVTFHCTHISYRQSYLTVAGTNIHSLETAFDLLRTAVPQNPFTYQTDKASRGYLSSADGVPKSVRSMLGGVEGSILDAYGGEYEWDKFNVILHSARGVARDFSIRYGVNMLDYEDEYGAEGTYSSCVPYWTGDDIVIVGNKVNSDSTTITGRGECVPLDLTDKFENEPTQAELESMALSYMNSNNTALPSQTIHVEFVRLQDLAEFEGYERLFECNLCDTINVIYPDFNGSGRYKIVKTVWNVLADRYESMELGDLSMSLAEALGVTPDASSDSTGGTDNAVGIHIVPPIWISEEPFTPDTHLANGFTADANFFYIAHHVQDSDPLTITRVNKTSLETTDYTMPFDGHGNTLSYYGGYLYITDSISGRVDVVSTSDPETLIGSFTIDPKINGFSIKNLEGRPITVSTESNNNVLLSGYVLNGLNQIVSRMAMEDSANSYTQGIDHTFNCIYVSRSYGQTITRLQNLPTITAYSWSGKVLNSVFIALRNITSTKDVELEDIWRDSDNDRIYFVTASGRIGYFETASFTTSQTHHFASPQTMRNSELFTMALYSNTNPAITYRSGTTMMQSMTVNPYTTQNQGEYMGVGLIAGVNAIFALRAGGIFGYTVPASSSKNIVCASAEYTYSNGVLNYSNGSVFVLNNDGTITKQTLPDFSDANTTNRTVINSLIHIPFAIPYTSALATIPLPS